jgi:hypothetical protein
MDTLPVICDEKSRMAFSVNFSGFAGTGSLAAPPAASVSGTLIFLISGGEKLLISTVISLGATTCGGGLFSNRNTPRIKMLNVRATAISHGTLLSSLFFLINLPISPYNSLKS